MRALNPLLDPFIVVGLALETIWRGAWRASSQIVHFKVHQLASLGAEVRTSRVIPFSEAADREIFNWR